MAVPLARGVAHDDLHAAVGCVVGPLSLLTIRVPDTVGILLVKLHTPQHTTQEKTTQQDGSHS